MQEQTIFDLLYPKFQIDKPIRLITLFSGYDSQALALKYLGMKYEHWKTCEWAVKSIQALKDLHFGNDKRDYSESFDIDQIKAWLLEKGISHNYNEPMTEKQIKNMAEPTARRIFNNIVATRNLVNIQKAKGKDFEIKNTDQYNYIMTYSFPCQDLSLAGNKKGMSDTSTRSGMLWEVERILTEMDEKPQVLLMENVPQVHSQDNIEDFKKWISRLEELGYQNYWQDLIATDFGIPQTRNRCFMVSILGDYSYSFPPKQTLNLKLKNLLEENVDEKYYLSDKMIRYIYSDENSGKYQRKKARESCDRNIEKGIASTITTSAGNRPTDNFIKIKNATKKRYLETKEGDGIDINRLQLGKEVSDTLQTTQKEKIVNSNLRIRKLTPKECFRLMGVKDSDFNKIKKNQTDSSLYHLAGDSIVVNVLMAIFKEMKK